LGLILLQGADFKAAEEHFEKAARLGLEGAHYYLGRIAVYGGDGTRATTHYAKVPPDDPHWAAAQHGLGFIAMSRGEWAEAIEWIRPARSDAGRATQTSLCLAMALRRAGEADAAAEALNEVLSVDPLNLVALREMSLIRGPAGEEASTLRRLLADDPEYPIDLACFYLDCGLSRDALDVLKAVPQPQPPMCGYLAAYVASTLGEKDVAEQFAQVARLGGPERVFPSRLWEIIALQHPIQHRSPDPKAQYYLGTFYFAHDRFAEAAALWEVSRHSLGDFDVVYRNLGLLALRVENDPVRAAQWFEEALRINPQNQDLYLDLDRLYQDQGVREKRIQLLKAMDRLHPLREDVRKRRLSVLVDLGMYDEALRLLTTESFVPLEMDQSFHQVYVRALLQRAEADLAADRPENAIQAYRAALEFPANQGVGKPTTTADAEILYRLGCVYEMLGRYSEAIEAWKKAGSEHHAEGEELYKFVLFSLDKLGRYSDLGFDI
jgi:tetratricopeptide (TPR) repeat protein